MKSAFAAVCIAVPFLFSACSKTSDEIFTDGMMDYLHIIVENNGNCEESVKKLDRFVQKRGEKMGLALADMVKAASKQVSEDTAQSPLQLIADELEFLLTEEEYEIAKNPLCAKDEAFKAVQTKFGEVLLKPVFIEMAGDVDKAIKNDISKINPVQ